MLPGLPRFAPSPQVPQREEVDPDERADLLAHPAEQLAAILHPIDFLATDRTGDRGLPEFGIEHAE